MARSIRRLLDLYDGHSVASAIRSYDEDESAVKLLHMFHPVMLNTYTLQRVIGDGNCVFRRASLGVYGHQEAHVYLRLMTAVEMIQHRTRYDTESAEHTADRPSYHEFMNVTSYDTMR